MTHRGPAKINQKRQATLSTYATARTKPKGEPYMIEGLILVRSGSISGPGQRVYLDGIPGPKIQTNPSKFPRHRQFGRRCNDILKVMLSGSHIQSDLVSEIMHPESESELKANEYV